MGHSSAAFKRDLQKAEALIDQHRSGEALKLLHPRLKKAPPTGRDAAEAAMVTGIAHFRLGDFGGAQQQFSRAVLLNARDRYAPYYLGLAYERQGNLWNALLSYRLANSLDPGFAEARYKSASLTDQLTPELPAMPSQKHRRKRHPVVRVLRFIMVLIALLVFAGIIEFAVLEGPLSSALF